jgi:endoglycosylceramidase
MRTVVILACSAVLSCTAATSGDRDDARDVAAEYRSESEIQLDRRVPMDIDAEEISTHPVAQVVSLRPLSASADRRIVDDLGRDVLLRGVNITSLGEYWQGDPLDPPTLPTTDADWDAMAARGVSVIRLVIHWSRIEPLRGQMDESYLDEIDGYVRKAASRGIYTVLDMHQDAYSAFIYTTPDEECPAGTHPAKGWDGAPAWAVFTDGLSTCTPGERNASPAVKNAWNAFYDNREGIRDRFVASWVALARRFAGRPEVAGFDVLNEPEASRPSSEMQPLYDAFIQDVYLAIRQAQRDAPFEHLIFVEPALPAAHPDYGLVVPDISQFPFVPTNVVSSPHNYAESIGVPGMTVTFEAMNELFLTFGQVFGVPTWIGEYGFWDTRPETLEKLGRYARDEDKHRLGGAWW